MSGCEQVLSEIHIQTSFTITFISQYDIHYKLFLFSVEYMRDFYVVGSNMSFPLSLPGPMNGTMYELCGQYPGTPPDGSLAQIICRSQPMIAQYVSVYGNKYSKYIGDPDDRGEINTYYDQYWETTKK